MICAKCDLKTKNLSWHRFGYVKELKAVGVFMKQYRQLCRPCAIEVKKK